MEKKPKHPPTHTWDCPDCLEVYFSKAVSGVACPNCGRPMLKRIHLAAEPFEPEAYAAGELSEEDYWRNNR